MPKFLEALFFTFLIFPQVGLGFSHRLAVCPGVLSSQIVDPINNSSIVVNFDPESKYYVFLRCGDSSRERSSASVKNCHIYKQGHESHLCREEIRNTRLGRIVGHGIDYGVSSVTGGVSNFSRLRRVFGAAREQRRPHSCLGLSLMKLTAYGQDTRQLVQAHYQLHTEIAPMTSLERLSARTPQAQESLVFEQLDYFLYAAGRRTQTDGSRRIEHRGPAYMTAHRTAGGDSRIQINENLKPQLCSEITKHRSGTAPEESPQPQDSAA